MKKSLLAIAFALVAMAGSAQIYVGGSFDIKFDDSPNISRFGIAPEAGYVLNENLGFGAVLDFEYQWNEHGNYNLWTFAPYARYTFLNSGKFSCFVDGVIEFSGAKGADAAFGIYAQPGIAYNVTDNISVVSHIGKLGWDDKSFVLNGKASIAEVGVYYTF